MLLVDLLDYVVFVLFVPFATASCADHRDIRREEQTSSCLLKVKHLFPRNLFTRLLTREEKNYAKRATISTKKIQILLIFHFPPFFVSNKATTNFNFSSEMPCNKGFSPFCEINKLDSINCQSFNISHQLEKEKEWWAKKE